MGRGLILEAIACNRGHLSPDLKYGAYPVLAPVSRGYPESQGQITHALLTRAPLYSVPEATFLVRLACVRHAASVHSEPGSNSPVKITTSNHVAL